MVLFTGKSQRIAPRPGSRLVSPPAPASGRAPVRTLATLLSILAVLTLGLGPVWSDGPSSRLARKANERAATLASVTDDSPKSHSPTCDEAIDELSLRARLVGAWEDEHMGRRVMTLRPDGSGTMLVELRDPAKLVIGPRLMFTLNWTVQQRTLSLTMTGGEPAKKVDMITRRFGDRATQHIEEIDGQWLLVHDLDDGDEFAFRRLEPTVTQLDFSAHGME